MVEEEVGKMEGPQLRVWPHELSHWESAVEEEEVEKWGWGMREGVVVGTWDDWAEEEGGVRGDRTPHP